MNHQELNKKYSDDLYNKQMSYSRKQKQQNNKTLKIGSFILSCVISVICFATCGDDSEVAPDNQYNSYSRFSKIEDWRVWSISQQFVKRHLKSPSSAEFPSEGYRVSNTLDTYMVVGYVDAQNGFGAQIRSRYVCKILYLGGRDESWSEVFVVIE